MAISYGTYTIAEVQEGSQIWTSSAAPASPNYTFTISKLVGDSDTSVKVGDIIMYSYYRYTVLSVSDTTVLTGNRQSIRGGTGAASVTYTLILSSLAIVKDKNGDLSPTTITLTAKSQTGSNAMANYSGRFMIETTADNSTWTTQYTSSANEATKTWNVISNIVAIRCSLYLKDGTTTLLDQQTIPIVSDGIDGTNITITSTSVTYQSGTSGTTQPSGTWQSTVPSVAQGNYLWTKTVVNYSDNTSTESYSVARQGSNGTNGTDGTSPTVSSTFVEYQQSTNGQTVPTGTWSTTPPTAIAEQYIWTRTTVTYSDNATAVSYSVSRNGTNGTSISISSTSVTYQKGTSGTIKPTGTWGTSIPSVGEGEYLWTKTVVTYSDNSTTESYSVSRNAVNGTNGTSPTVTGTVTEYVQSSSGTTTPSSGWNTTPPTATAGQYMWTRVTVTYSDNATAVSYTVSKNGANGNNGINTATVYLYKRGTTTPSVPSGNTTYTFSTKKLTGTLDSWSQTIPTSGDGECYVTAAVASSDGTTDTIGTGEWSTPIQFNGTNGTNGTDGTNGLNQATIFLYKRGASVTKPTTSVTYTFSTGALSAEPNSWKRNIPAIDGNPCWVVSATAIGNGTSVTITGSNWSDPVKLVEDGADGKDAYSIILTNENHTFSGNTTSAIASEVDCNIIAYKGATQVASTIGTITGQPTGMTTSISDNGTTNTSFTVSVTTSMVTKNGVLTVPITVDGKSFTKEFTYSLTLDGEKGDKGDTAQWYYGDSLTHTSGTATLPISQTEDVIIGAMYLNTKTGACYKCTAISGTNATWTYAGNITDGIEIGGRNLIIGTLHPDARSGGIYRPHIFGQISNTAGRGTCTVAEHGIRFTNTTANWQYIYFGASGNSSTPCMLGLEVGETYTLSADLSWKILSSDTGKADATTNYMGATLWYSQVESGSFSAINPISNFPITQADKGTEMTGRLEYTFTVPTTAKRLYLGIRSDNSTASHYAIGDYIEARNLKLEKGNKTTDWTPAPEDIDAEISTKADSSDAVSEEQLIYISKASGTLSVDGTTTWITENGDVQNTWSTKRPTYDTNYPVLFIAKQRKTVSGTVSCTTPLKDDTTTIIDGGHITTGTIDASQVAVTNINASNISTGTLSADRIGTNSIDASKINVSSISIGDLSGASNYAQKTDIGWCVLINVSAIDFINNTATLHASVYKDGTIQSSGFALQWYKTTTSTDVTPEVTTTTAISGATSDVLSVNDLDASYTCIVN